ncbi:MAG: tetratricopeptide repeat protein [Desulfosudaceae bacterium]
MKHLLVGIILGGLLAAGCAAGPPAAPPEPAPNRAARKLLQQALDQYQRGCDAAALEYFHRAHELFSLTDQAGQVAACLNNIGNIHRRSGQTDTALRFFTEAERIFRQTEDTDGVAQALSNRAATLLTDGRLAAAAVLLDEAISLVPDRGALTARIRNHQAILLMRQGKDGAAETELRRAAGLVSPRDGAAFAAVNASLGRLLLATGRPEEARECFEKAYRADRERENYPALAADLAALAEACQALGQPDQAFDYLARSVKLQALTGQARAARSQLETLSRLAAETDRDITLIRRFVEHWLAGEMHLDYCR